MKRERWKVENTITEIESGNKWWTIFPYQEHDGIDDDSKIV